MASQERLADLKEKFAARSDNTSVAHMSMHCYCEQNTLPPSFTMKQQSSFVLVLQEKWDEPMNKMALGRFHFGFLEAGWFVPPISITFLVIWGFLWLN